MGVISTNRTALPTCGDDFFPVDYLIESPITTDDEDNEPQQPQLPTLAEYAGLSRRRRRADTRRYPYFYQNIVGGKKNLGVRKQRRLENSRLLAALVDKEEICDDLSDTLPETISAFTQLFLEAEKMKVWNAFIHKSEEEQREILFGRRRRKSAGHHGKNNGKAHQRQTKSVSESSGGQPAASQEEKRQIHPAYSGSACFRRIEARLKTLLTHKHVPWEKLEQFERDLTDFFTTSPDGVFVTVLESGYDRLLLHAVAQYLRLRSQSIGPSDHRETQIESYSDRDFTPPVQTLADYIRQHYGKASSNPGDGFETMPDSERKKRS